MKHINPIFNADSYKASHFKQYPPGTEYVYAYCESRGGEFDRSLFFGLQMFIKQYLTVPITKEDIDEAEEMIVAHGLPFNREGWEYILYNHRGFMPVEIKAVPEGHVIKGHNVLVTIVNTDPKCFWLVSYMETALLRAIWYPTTVATISWNCKKIIKKYLEQTADNSDGLMFKLHDFGARGVSSYESACIGGTAHLVNFMGTDTMSALKYAKEFYFEPMAGFSIPASEHSTMTSWGAASEEDAYKNMLVQFGGEGKLLAVVSDSYNIWNAVDNIWGGSLKQDVLDMKGTLVVRPDSGDPEKVPVSIVEHLGAKFGYTTNSKGFKMLPSSVRVIQGDGINVKTLPGILDSFVKAGWSTDNIAFGMGSGLLQQCNRDTLKFAMKTSAVMINGNWQGVKKDPIDDPSKASKSGRFKLKKVEGGSFVSVSDGYGTPLHNEVYSPAEYDKSVDVLEVAYNQTTIRNQSLKEIRIIANSYL